MRRRWRRWAEPVATDPCLAHLTAGMCCALSLPPASVRYVTLDATHASAEVRVGLSDPAMVADIAHRHDLHLTTPLADGSISAIGQHRGARLTVSWFPDYGYAWPLASVAAEGE